MLRVQVPFNGVFEVGLANGAVVQEDRRTGAVLASHWARWMLLKDKDTQSAN